MDNRKKMHRSFENFMAEKIEMEIRVPLYENKYNQDVVEDIIDQYVKVDYNLTVKDEMVTIELEDAPSKEATFDDKLFGKELMLVKLGDEGSTANYRIEPLDESEKKAFENKLITAWLTTLPDNHDDWDWADETLTFYDKDMNPVETFTREDLVSKIAGFPQS